MAASSTAVPRSSNLLGRNTTTTTPAVNTGITSSPATTGGALAGLKSALGSTGGSSFSASPAGSQVNTLTSTPTGVRAPTSTQPVSTFSAAPASTTNPAFTSSPSATATQTTSRVPSALSALGSATSSPTGITAATANSAGMTKEQARQILASGQGDVTTANKVYYGTPSASPSTAASQQTTGTGVPTNAFEQNVTGTFMGKDPYKMNDQQWGTQESQQYALQQIQRLLGGSYNSSTMFADQVAADAGSPYQWQPQRTINVNGTQMNVGEIAKWYKNHDQAGADQLLRNELQHLGLLQGMDSYGNLGGQAASMAQSIANSQSLQAGQVYNPQQQQTQQPQQQQYQNYPAYNTLPALNLPNPQGYSSVRGPGGYTQWQQAGTQATTNPFQYGGYNQQPQAYNPGTQNSTVDQNQLMALIQQMGPQILQLLLSR